jgi:hypothetical protein
VVSLRILWKQRRDSLPGAYAQPGAIPSAPPAFRFVYISGDHGSGRIDKDAIYPHTERIERLCRDLASGLSGWDVEVVCGPATGGLIVAQWLAHELGILSVFTEHDLRLGRGPAE